MTMSNRKYFEERLERLANSYQDSVDRTVEFAFISILKPYFAKYALEFISGNGDFYLGCTEATPAWYRRKYVDPSSTYKGDTTPHIDCDLLPKKIRDILYMPIPLYAGNDLGSICQSYSPPE